MAVAPGVRLTRGDRAGPLAPAPPLAAATLIVTRDGPAGPEALLLRRARSARFMPNAYVFPGGLVDDSDGSDAVIDRWDGLTPKAARSRLGLPAESAPPAIAYFGAAVRETFEETGLLPGCRRSPREPGGPHPRLGGASSDDGAIPAAAVRAREALLDGRRSFASILEELGMRLNGTTFAYVARWITPPSVAKRYDTRFFACTVPPDAQAVTDEREAAGAAWLTPARALALRAEGSLTMIFPTASTLQDCVGFDTAKELVSHLRRRRAVERTPAKPLPGERKTLGLPEA